MSASTLAPVAESAPELAGEKPSFWERPLAWLLLTVASVVYAFSKALNWDAAFYVLEAKALAEGREIYRTFPDYGLPSTVQPARLALWLADRTGFYPADVQHAFLVAFIAAIAWFTLVLMMRLFPRPARLVAAPLVFVTFFIYPSFDAAQRDVIFGAAVLPLLLIGLGRALGRTIASPALVVLAGAVAAVAASQKPHFMLTLALLPVADAVARGGLSKRWFLDWLTPGLLLAVFLGAVGWIYPHYFREVLPMAAASYGSLRPSPLFVIGVFLYTLFLAVVAGPALWRAWKNHGRPFPERLLWAWVLVCVILTISYASQGQGFPYHRRPPGMWFLLSLGLVAMFFTGRARAGLLTPVAFTCFFAVATFPVRGHTRAYAFADPLSVILRSLPPKTPVLTIDTSPPPTTTLVSYSHVRWTGQQGCLIEPRIIQEARDALKEHGRPIPAVIQALEADMRRRLVGSFTPAPDVLFFNTADEKELGWFATFYFKPFRLMPFLAEDPEFVRLLAGYERVGSIRSMREHPYDVYVRKGARLPKLPALKP